MKILFWGSKWRLNLPLWHYKNKSFTLTLRITGFQWEGGCSRLTFSAVNWKLQVTIYASIDLNGKQFFMNINFYAYISCRLTSSCRHWSEPNELENIKFECISHNWRHFSSEKKFPLLLIEANSLALSCANSSAINNSYHSPTVWYNLLSFLSSRESFHLKSQSAVQPEAMHRFEFAKKKLETDWKCSATIEWLYKNKKAISSFRF